jgi:hypothetical protein
MTDKVFIISTQKDADLALELTRRLEKAGIKVLSKKFHGSDAIDNRIRRSLHQSEEVLVLLTDKALNNERITVLLGAAFGVHKPITAILVGVREHELPFRVHGMRHLKYAEVDEYISELQSRSEKVVV